MTEDLHWRSASELARLLRDGEVSAREALDACIARVESVDPIVNAVVFRMYEEARRAASAADDALARGAPVGALHGVPVSIKDQFLVHGTPSTWGKKSRARHRAEREGPLLGRLRNAGAIPFVKTNVPVLLLEGETHNPLHGRTRNPWNAERTSGGSSGGESALIAAGGSPLGLGSDIGGSLRVPAHFAGVASLKPTANRLPRTDDPEDFPLWAEEIIVPQAGPMGRTVADVALGYRVLVTGRDSAPSAPEAPPVAYRDPDDVDVRGLGVAVWDDDGLFSPSPSVKRALREAATVLQEAGATIVQWRPPSSGAEILRLYTGILGADGFRFLDDHLGEDPGSPMVRFLTMTGRLPARVARFGARLARAAGQHSVAPVLSGGGTGSVHDLAGFVNRLVEVRREAAVAFDDGVDIVLCPPHALPALLHDTYRDLVATNSYTFLANLLGLPGGVVPVTNVLPGEESTRRPGVDIVERLARRVERGSAGLPVGVQVMGPWWREDLVLAVMAAIEERVEGCGRPPL